MKAKEHATKCTENDVMIILSRILGMQGKNGMKIPVTADAESASKDGLQHDDIRATATVRDRIKQFSAEASIPLEKASFSRQAPSQNPSITAKPPIPPQRAALKPGTKLVKATGTELCGNQQHGRSRNISPIAHFPAVPLSNKNTSAILSSDSETGAELADRREFTASKAVRHGSRDPHAEMSSWKSPTPLPQRKKEAPPVPPRSSQLSTESELLQLDPPSLHTDQEGSGVNHTLEVRESDISDSALADAMTASYLIPSHAALGSKRGLKQPPPPPPPRQRGSPSQPLLQLSSDSSKVNPPALGPDEILKRGMDMLDEPKSGSELPPKPPRRVTFNPNPEVFQIESGNVVQGQVISSERKRYEEVWEANRGVARFGVMHDPNVDQKVIRKSLAYEDLVVDLVVRDIWSRSRLPQAELAKIWKLHDAVGMLSREEFVVGMWLIDQCLKGHGLPTNVPKSVWKSVQ
ncbi:LOW QUALITY PROTEIN: hypothetical protein CIHG_05726 [Coccidioides immitis H538.4]|uniref:EH domain-containing protein n=1 Tax=Coccidioides immitis H538.4 TaxID=396776 RepID=A0A0J8RV54_COCIT|nr:LOW QUALITY PROTEIN: hypothetical protein CIHG_05726 [Coccidioides immitis H538.4]